MDKKHHLQTISIPSTRQQLSRCKVAAENAPAGRIGALHLSENAVIWELQRDLPKEYECYNAERRKIILQYIMSRGYITKEQQEEGSCRWCILRIQNVKIRWQRGKRTALTVIYRCADLWVTQSLINEGWDMPRHRHIIFCTWRSIHISPHETLTCNMNEWTVSKQPWKLSGLKYSLEYRLTVQTVKNIIDTKRILAQVPLEGSLLWRLKWIT